ncbi:hypothetical protein SK128_028238, partial [Halocaridina rubra]
TLRNDGSRYRSLAFKRSRRNMQYELTLEAELGLPGCEPGALMLNSLDLLTWQDYEQ